ncbi:MAG: hypothetical protein WC525_06400, partial [Candidatus Thermoplasmatota archaeon]
MAEMLDKKISHHHSTRFNLPVLLAFIVFSCIIFLFLIVHPSFIGISYDWNSPLSLAVFTKTPLTSSWVNNSPTMPGNAFYLQVFYGL